MDYDDNTLNSLPTMGPDGVRRTRVDVDELSLGSAPTMGPGWDTSTMRPPFLGQIDQYQLARKLGGGGFGVVYLARDTVSGVDVALKTLHPLLKSNPEEMEALRTKFALVSRLSHPNIASLLVLHPCRDIVITDEDARRELRLSPGDNMMVMRYAPGVTLSKWRKQFPGGIVPLDLVLEVARQIASALDYAHGERIVHRDIKPSNVVVETTSPQPDSKAVLGLRVRILDFGLAAEIRSSMSRVSTETGDTSGTRPYMAPEQWQGKKQDGRTDQYALACVLYELLSGAPPFSGVFETGDTAIMKDAVVRDLPEDIEGVSAHVNAALQKALAKNPRERFDNCATFVEECLAKRAADGRADLHVGQGRDGAEKALDDMRKVQQTQEALAHKSKEEAEKWAREEVERKAKLEFGRRQWEEAQRKAKAEAERRLRERTRSTAHLVAKPSAPLDLLAHRQEYPMGKTAPQASAGTSGTDVPRSRSVSVRDGSQRPAEGRARNSVSPAFIIAASLLIALVFGLLVSPAILDLRIRSLQAEIDAAVPAENAVRENRDKSLALGRLRNQSLALPVFLREVSSAMPKDVQLLGFRFDAQGAKASFQGPSSASAFATYDKLKRLPIFKNVALNGPIRDGDKMVFRFEISLKLAEEKDNGKGVSP